MTKQHLASSRKINNLKKKEAVSAHLFIIFLSAQRTENHVLFFGVQFKYPVGVVLSISGEGVIIWWASSEVESGLRKLPAEGVWDETSVKHTRLFWYMDSRD